MPFKKARLNATLFLLIGDSVYRTERALVRALIAELRNRRSPWGTVAVSREFDYQRGRADVLALSEDGSHLIAFEAKLKRWRVALHQAYRNTCFAHSSYVVLPREATMTAQRWCGEFSRRNVGLCYIQNGKIKIVFTPDKQAPLEPWLLTAAAAAVRGNARRRPSDCGPQNLRKARHAVCKARRRGNVQADI